ncbi:MAG: TSUP family transporter [Arenicella sp.]|nr:TSUP family transporter [Arenicella sp.]
MPSLLTLFLLVVAAFVAGYIDTLVGGGGLITIPALMLAGVPPIFALGTNKLQAVAGSGTAALTMFRRGKVKFEDVSRLMGFAFLGSLVGAVAVQYFDATVLNLVIPLVIIFIAIYFLCAPAQSLVDAPAKLSAKTFGLTAVPGIGLYDGMFGPGTGSFFVWAGVSLRGQPIVYSTMAAKSLNVATNVAALLVFAFYAKVLWKVGLVMMVGQALGAWLGARSLMTINPSSLRYLVIAVCFIILLAWAIR